MHARSTSARRRRVWHPMKASTADAQFLQLRVRTTMSGMFVWDLMTFDGHVVNTSEPFGTRIGCVQDAKQHKLPILGVNPLA